GNFTRFRHGLAPGSLICGTYGLARNHFVDCVVLVAEITEDLPGVLANARSIRLEARGGFGLSDTPHGRLIELFDDLTRNHLFVLDDLAAAQDRSTRYVCLVQTCQPLRRRVLADVFLH